VLEIRFRIESSIDLAQASRAYPEAEAVLRVASEGDLAVTLLGVARGPRGARADIEDALRQIPGASMTPLAPTGGFRLTLAGRSARPVLGIVSAARECSGGEAVLESIHLQAGVIVVRILAPSFSNAARLREALVAKGAISPRGRVEVLSAEPWRPESEEPPSRGLSEKELATLRTAVALGYYETPRRCTMEDLGAALGVTKTSVFRRLAVAERRAAEELLQRAVPATSAARSARPGRSRRIKREAPERG
jgi:hypothetical protein